MGAELRYTVQGAPVTKKTGQQIVTTGKRPILLPSRAYREARKYVIPQLQAQHQGDPIAHPVQITADFYVGKRQRPDTTGLGEALGDFLQEAGVLSNDYHVKRWELTRHRDWNNPRIEIVIQEAT